MLASDHPMPVAQKFHGFPEDNDFHLIKLNGFGTTEFLARTSIDTRGVASQVFHLGTGQVMIPRPASAAGVTGLICGDRSRL